MTFHSPGDDSVVKKEDNPYVPRTQTAANAEEDTRGQKTHTAETREAETRAIMYVDPMSAMKMGFLLGAVMFAVWIVAAIVLFLVLAIVGVWSRLNSLIVDLTGAESLGFGLYFGAVLILGIIELGVITLFAPVAAIAYNATAALLGGLRIKVDDSGSAITTRNDTAAKTSGDAKPQAET
ncbi:hypothetical protein GSS87_09020 [Corynebacterium sp. 4HC-13]|uniref:DUF3566 domain-containing protein n=1 Tax=Corynebacterium anserum TaxID=2684406 RepID=UPI00163988F9|nr:DUF3566 domain-containing protein [Corynebacterium anserum]MBC2682526.1 hypothetical protein [Corynebacterium anserum]